MRTDAINLALEVTITRERLEKYLVDCGHDLNAAITLYETNVRLSEAMYVPLQSLEICLRNTVNAKMQEAYGAEWLTDHTVAPLNDFSRKMVNEAIDAIDGVVTQGKIVAEAKFAFWVGLHGPQYDATLWRSALHKAFRIGGGKKRSLVHGRLNAIRRFRNRVAHHEPIFHRDVARTHTEIVEAIGWMCSDTRDWTAHMSRVPQVLDE